MYTYMHNTRDSEISMYSEKLCAHIYCVSSGALALHVLKMYDCSNHSCNMY